MKKTEMFKCVECDNHHFAFSVEPTSIYFLCTECHTLHTFNTFSGTATLTRINGAALAPQQEPAVQVPATAPAAGHLSKGGN